MQDAADTRPILIVPYMWIGDFVRGHTVVRVLKQRWPNRPVDLLATTLPALEQGQIDLDTIFASVDTGLAQLEAGFPL